MYWSHAAARSRKGQHLRGWPNTVGNLIEIVWVNKNLSRASSYQYVHETQRGTASSHSRFQTVLFQQYSANLSNTRDAADSHKSLFLSFGSTLAPWCVVPSPHLLPSLIC